MAQISQNDIEEANKEVHLFLKLARIILFPQ